MQYLVEKPVGTEKVDADEFWITQSGAAFFQYEHEGRMRIRKVFNAQMWLTVQPALTVENECASRIPTVRWEET